MNDIMKTGGEGPGGLQIDSIDDAIKFAQMICKTAFAPKGSTPEGLVIAMQFGREVGLPPLQAIQNIAVINGKPSIYGDAALGLAQNHPGWAGMREWTERGAKDLIAYCAVTRKGQAEQVRSFSWSQATRAGLTKKPGPWQQYPERMLQMRARGFALRDTFADALKGLITREEAEDIPPEQPSGGARVSVALPSPSDIHARINPRKQSAAADPPKFEPLEAQPEEPGQDFQEEPEQDTFAESPPADTPLVGEREPGDDSGEVQQAEIPGMPAGRASPADELSKLYAEKAKPLGIPWKSIVTANRSTRELPDAQVRGYIAKMKAAIEEAEAAQGRE